MERERKIALRLGVALLATTALLSCSKSGGSGGSFNDAPGSGDFVLTPGEYETTFKITKGSAEGLPKEMQDELARAQANPQTQRSCIPIGFSLQSASIKNLRYSFQNYGGCVISDISQGGGSLHGALNCEIKNLPKNKPDAPAALSINADWTGSYSANTWNAKGHGEFSEPGGSRKGSADVEISVRRVGECPSNSSPFGPAMPPPSDNMSPGDNMTTTE